MSPPGFASLRCEKGRFGFLAYVDTSNVAHSFILSGATYTSFDPPFGGVIFSVATGINPRGVIVGTFFDAASNEHGYIRTP